MVQVELFERALSKSFAFPLVTDPSHVNLFS
jgi:hypothetical protein